VVTGARAGDALVFKGDGSLSVSGAGDGESTDTFVHNPADPVQTLGGAVLPGAVLAGPFDQRAIEQRADVLVYTSGVLTEAMEMTGAVEAVLWISSSTADGDYVARLVDVYPDGRAINLCEGIARVASDEGREVRIDLHATSNLFAGGHRVRLDVASSSYPHYAVNRRGAR
jgi:putative CocE/NonD family hydrolase